jgi:hypothetical protein
MQVIARLGLADAIAGKLTQLAQSRRPAPGKSMA